MARWEPWTLDQVKEKYYQWEQASIAVSTSKSYTIDGRTLTRENLDEIRKMMAYWENEADRIINGRKSVNRVMRFVPRDL